MINNYFLFIFVNFPFQTSDSLYCLFSLKSSTICILLLSILFNLSISPSTTPCCRHSFCRMGLILFSFLFRIMLRRVLYPPTFLILHLLSCLFTLSCPFISRTTFQNLSKTRLSSDSILRSVQSYVF